MAGWWFKIKFRDFSSENKSRFTENISIEFTNYSPPFHDIDLCTSYLISFLKNLIEKYFPIKEKTFTQKRLRAPWLDSDIMRCIRKKHEWYRLLINGNITRDSYKKYCSLLRKILKFAQENYMTRKLDSLGSDPKKNFEILNRLLGRKRGETSDNFIIEGVTICEPYTISNEFNAYFIRNPSNIHQNIY